MTNKVNQEIRNNEKWNASVNAKIDLSGKMLWCDCCPEMQDNECNVTQAERDKGLLCARAYNRMKRDK